MSQQDQELKTMAVVRLIGQAPDSHAIPADVLIRTLYGLQRLVYLVASDSENKKLGQRFRVADSIERQYKLVCKLPQPGSFAVPLTLERDDPQQLNILSDISYVNVFQKVEDLFQAIQTGAKDGISNIFSDRTFAKRALIEVRKLLPNADDSWKLGFTYEETPEPSEVMLTKESVKHIDDWLTQESPSESVITITGELIKIDFDERKLYLRYPPSRQVIECIYSDEMEDTMIENRRQYVQVTGEFTVDADGNPIKLTDVTRIEPLDLSPIVLREVTYKKRMFLFTEPLQFAPQLDEEGKQLLVIDKPDLGLNVFARTREELVEEISEQVAFLWDEFALAEEDSLTPEAQKLRNAILKAVKARDAA